MNTEKINALFLTLEKGSISAAAEQLNYTPSAISRCIQSLENELGIPLLTRSKHGVEITEAGRMMLPDLRRILQDEAVIKEHALQLADGTAGTIRLGMCYPSFYPWVSSAMATFKAMYPDVKYIVKNGFSSVLMEQIYEKELDLCMISKLDDSCGWVPLFKDDMVAIIHPDHPLASRDSVPISAYAEEPYLELHSDKDTDNSRALRAAGIQPETTINVDDSSAMYPMVEAGLGIGMENRINTSSRQGSFVIKPLDPPQIIELGIAYRTDSLPVVRKFIDHLVKSKDMLTTDKEDSHER